ncbi:MAG TPA: hypothetical protein VHL56_04005 [Candidatus Limnocylindrales bacterium]|nr:hypothetical protein [Candidatus Limnocylindrales bacterium]
MSMVRRLLPLAVVLLVLGACQGTPVQLPGSGPLLTVTARGGECPAGACEQSVILERDGRAHVAAKPPNDLGKVPPEAMAALTAAINQTDFAALKSRPFTGQCPTAVDGQELVFEFNVGTTTQRIASCEVAIDWGSPLFVAVGAALGQWVALPLT